MSCIVVEGPDGTGKTTLARALEKRGFEYRHEGVPAEGVNIFEYYTQCVLNARGANVVFDRLHLGEMAYGPVMRTGSKISVEQMKLLNRLLFSLGMKFVFCDTDDAAIEENWKKRQAREYVDNTERLRKVASNFRTLFAEFFTLRDVVYFDYRTSLLPQHLEEKHPFPEVLCSRKCWPGVIGSPRARFLLVGERADGKDSCGADLAFYSDQKSSHFLNECLWEAGYQEEELAFANIMTMDATYNDIRAIYRNNPAQTIIALGKVASNRCHNLGVPRLEIPHPAFFKRFKSKSRDKYVELLQRFRGAN